MIPSDILSYTHEKIILSPDTDILNAKLNAKNQEERKKLWFNHFSKLLGEKPTQSEDTIIEDIFENLDIEDGAFTLDEYRKAKKATREGSAAGDDGLPTEIFTRCDFDDIMLDYCNRLHILGEKPEQWGGGRGFRETVISHFSSVNFP